MLLVLVVFAAVVLCAGVFYILIKRLLYVATPNEVLIFCGSTRQVYGKRVGYRFVRGGRSLRVPFLERVERLDLNMFTVMVNVEQAFTKGGIPLDVQGVANVKLPGDEPLLANAVERFLGRSRDEIYHIAKETLEGNLRGVLAGLTPEEVNQDKQRFAEQLLEEAEHDMTRMGLVLDTLKIQNVSDKVKYLSSAGRIRGADLNQRQAAAEALARTDARVQQQQNWSGSEVAKLTADLEIARQETRKRVADATSRRAAMVAESRGRCSRRSPACAPTSRGKPRAPCRCAGSWTPTWSNPRSPSCAPRKRRRAARPPGSSSVAVPTPKAWRCCSPPTRRVGPRRGTCSCCKSCCRYWEGSRARITPSRWRA